MVVQKLKNNILSKKAITVVLMAYLIIGFSIYFPVLWGKFMIDDYGEIVLNSRVHNIKNILRFFSGSTFFDGNPELPAGTYFRPLKMIWYSLIYTFFGPRPLYFHIFQILLHVVNTVILFLIFSQFLPFLLAFFLGSIFLVHPINVEAVAYIAATQDPIYFFFGISGLFLLLSAKSFSNKLIWLLTLFFLIGLLAKETMIVFALIFLIGVYVRWRLRRVILLGIYFFVAFLVYTTYRCWIIHLCKTGVDYSPLGHMAFLQFLYQIPAILYFYIRTFFYPERLIIAQHWYVRTIDVSHFYLPVIVLGSLFCALIFVLFVLYYRESTKWYSKAGLYTIFFSVFTAGLLIHSHILPLDFTVADQWFYTPMLGLLGMIGIILSEIITLKHGRLINAILMIIVSVLVLRSMYRVYLWRDQNELFLHDIKYNQDSYDLVNNVGYVMTEKGNREEGLRNFVKVTKLAPDYPVGWVNAGVLYEIKGDYDKAEEYYKKAVSIGPQYVAYKRYALLLIKRGKTREARSLMEKKILKDFPDDKYFRELYSDIKKT